MQTIFVIVVALVGGVVLAQTTFGQKVYAIGGNERAASFAGVDTRRVRFTAMVVSATCAACGGVIYDAFYRSFIPTAGQLRELDAISSIIIGGGSIFGGYGTMIGSLAGAGGHHADPLAAVAADHPERRRLFRAAAAMAERVHRRHPAHRRRRRHLAAPEQHSRPDGSAGRGGARGAGRARRGARDMTTPIVEMRGITKSFGPVQALVDVNLRLMPGEVLGLVGDNSAGKSTLMKILTGAYQRDAGEILIDGEPVRFRSPHESRDRGIEMIYQDFALCGNLDVGQNIFLGRWPLRFGLFVDRARMHRNAARNPDPAEGRRELGLSEGREPVGRAPAIGRHRPRDFLRRPRW